MKDKQTAELSNNRLLDLYLRYSNEIDEDLFGPTFSNPYYIKAPSDWWEKENRIMIVGEEGSGNWGAGKSYWSNGNEEWNPRTETGIKRIMDYNANKTVFQTIIRKRECFIDGEKYELNTGMFWSRIRKIYNLDDNISIVWNNIDKIHRLGEGGRACRLNDSQREKLHQVKVLKGEIAILRPSIIVFLGWHWTSLQEEVPEVFDDTNERYATDKNKPFLLNNMLFSLHPNSKAGRTKIYGGMVLEQIKSLLNH